jgi:hypothetical protein
MSRRIRPYPRCTATTKSGLTCSRRVTDGLQPAICHVHRAAMNGGVGLTRPVPFDPLTKLTRIAAQDAHPKQLEAIKQLLEHRCPRCAAERQKRDDWPSIFARLTSDERRTIHETIRAAQATVDQLFALARRRPIVDAPAPAPIEDDDADPSPAIAPATPEVDILGPDEVEL